MTNGKQIKTGGMSFGKMLTVLFIGLKLTNNISWSWFWVLSPAIISFIIMLFYIYLLTKKKNNNEVENLMEEVEDVNDE